MKEVLQGLVDDGLVQYDKIGASNCIIFPFLRAPAFANGTSLLELPFATWSHRERFEFLRLIDFAQEPVLDEQSIGVGEGRE